MNEIDFISHLTSNLATNESIVVGSGDDCAVLDLGIENEYCLFKTDSVVEGIHFDVETPPEKVGRKAVARALSDIAAMGGYPTHALITLGLPDKYDEDRVTSIYDGAKAFATEHKLCIVGGETTQAGQLLLSVALIGKVNRDCFITRSNSAKGDAIFVTGGLGGSLSGKHLDFEPRLKEARWLAKEYEIHAMIDLSDGLATDLRHLLHTKLGAELLTTAIPISHAAKEQAKAKPSGKTALLAALTDGEDYELLFTLPAKDAVQLNDAWKRKFPKLSLKCIGKITDGPEITLRDEKGAHPLNVHGYDHLQQP